ncbi:MAG: FtsX-like permease family protein, partial [Cyclobacteriaceae bacterium]
GLDWKGKNPEERILFENFAVSYDLMETIGFKFLDGRSFSKEFGADSSKIIINATAAKTLGFENPIGENIRLWDEYDMEIIGVVEDFHFQSFKREVAPAFFRLSGTWNVALRLEAGYEVVAMAAVQDFYEEYNSGFIFDYQFLDKGYEELYTSEIRVGTLSKYFAGFAILISCLGLFGLASFTAERRIKEIGVRKVLGATVTNIVMMLSKDFTRLVGISILLAIPISWYLMQEWLSNFAYKIDLGIGIFIGAALISLLIAWLTVSSQAMRAANINPAKCLKDE